MTLYLGDALTTLAALPARSARCCVTSPPYYGLRDYGHDGQIGLEATPEAYVARLVDVFRAVRRVLTDDGTLWLNLGDSYAGNGTLGRNDAGRNFTGGGGNTLGSGNPGRQGKHERTAGIGAKQLLGIPWRVAFALQADGWILRSDIIWHKPNAMPESVRDRPTKAHEYLFLLSKQPKYYYDSESIKEPISQSSIDRINQPNFANQTGGPKDYGTTGVNTNRSMRKTLENFAKNPEGGRNRRTVWNVATKPFSGAKLLADYVGPDGKPYTASPDCPIHGHLSRERKSYTGGYGGQLASNATRSRDNESHHDASPAIAQDAMTYRSHEATPEGNTSQRKHGSMADYRTDGPRHEHILPDGMAADTSGRSIPDVPQDHSPDSPRRADGPIATRHNTESHRTDPGPATIPPYMPSAQTTCGIGDTSALPLFSAQHPGSPENNNATGDSFGRPSLDTAVGTVHKPSSSDSSASPSPPECKCTIVSIDHFAVFPPALIEPCIFAGSAIGDTVLDPFAGSGTTGAVAVQHGRAFVGIELNAEYLALAEQRIAAAQPPLPMQEVAD